MTDKFRRAIAGNNDYLGKNLQLSDQMWQALEAKGVLTEEQVEWCRNNEKCPTRASKISQLIEYLVRKGDDLYPLFLESIVVTGENKEVVKKLEDKVPRAPREITTAGTTMENLEETSTPQVFVSYNWGKKTQVQVLVQKLKKSGFSCWMDEQQLSGGQSLLKELSSGIRGCKVFVACLTTAYFESDICRKELTLAYNTKKPIIPLKLEEGLQWPTDVDMILSPLLYVNFCKPTEAVQDTWDCPEFEHLVKSIKEHMQVETSASV